MVKLEWFEVEFDMKQYEIRHTVSIKAKNKNDAKNQILKELRKLITITIKRCV